MLNLESYHVYTQWRSTNHLCRLTRRWQHRESNKHTSGPVRWPVYGCSHPSFYYPYDGEDAGFDPIDHTLVDDLGDWENVKKLGESVDIMADLIVNHMSGQSEAFKDVLKNGRESSYWPLFLTKEDIFKGNDQTQIDEQIAQVFRPRPTPFFSDYEVGTETGNPETVPFWTTFTSNQIDIDVESQLAKTTYLLFFSRLLKVMLILFA